jgi:hypothetical protein
MCGTGYVGEDHAACVGQAERELRFVRHELNEHLSRSGWPTLADDEIDGLLRRSAAASYGLA